VHLIVYIVSALIALLGLGATKITYIRIAGAKKASQSLQEVKGEVSSFTRKLSGSGITKDYQKAALTIRQDANQSFLDSFINANIDAEKIEKS
jgi:hypothetical protein